MSRRIIALMSLTCTALLAVFSGCEEADEPPTMQKASELRADVAREQPAASDSDLAQLVADHTSFAFWMYQEGADVSGADANFIYSPLSISTAFSMLWPGAVGETADEIAEMLFFNMQAGDFHPAGNRLDTELASRNDYEPTEDEGDAPILEIVNDLWGLDEYPYVEDYLELLARHYGAGMWIVDFRNAPEEARQEINEYIDYKTRGLIPEILPGGSIDALTRLVLTNAIYFKGAWRFPFDEEATADAPFAALDGTTADVPMMSGSIDSAYYAEVDGTEILDVPYVGDDLSMTLILPEEGSFDSFESSFDESSLTSLLDAMEPSEGNLAMPRFSFDSELDLVSIFEAAGYSLPFTGSLADFSGLSEVALEEELHVTGAFHKAAIAVDEEGTEAAAVTAIVMGRESAPERTFDVHLDRPFLFMIRDRPTGTILFMGRIADAADAQD